jgi:hypothetical protein
MTAVQRLTLADLSKRLSPYKCRKLADVMPGVELWETGWHEPFTLTPEDGYYDEFFYRKVMILIGATMPPGWNIGNNGGA